VNGSNTAAIIARSRIPRRRNIRLPPRWAWPPPPDIVDSPNTRSYTKQVSSADPTSIADSAPANSQFCWAWICWMMTCPSIVSRGPPSRAGVMKKPSEPMNTSSPAAATPGMESWKNTRQNACTPDAPIVAAARTRPRSIWPITGSMLTTPSGSMVWTMPNTTVVWLNSISGGCAMPMARRLSAMAPLRPSSTSQTKFFTSALVQNGNSTSNASSRCRRAGWPDSQ
jgi:hypothetical protein